ncbi:DMT family transporter [Aestuariirhabdus sp. Z084]|uniref:DMT family transporter n=1 Tax=Aestuariirhabdus haliotis TaxID=2918751 RepID=UPI00201B3C4A|nr:DMT family transporter [Aestuariirhabdus haliotis]MCL6416247.1 DMT family transporter [Aestuariirhabdus haliotis]MCL6420293.1 DMT family transporter [Aestuariirhabdus haliotis]
MPLSRSTVALTALAMIAFAGNSLLCRMALEHTGIDAASFTSIRLLSGAIALLLLVVWRRQPLLAVTQGNWLSAMALFAYAAGFSFAYLSLSTATGALLLFGAVQITMIGVGLMRGERLASTQWLGLIMAISGLIGLLLPGLEAPSLTAALLMLGSGIAWGIYSLQGQGLGDPTQTSCGNFIRSLPIALGLSLLTLSHAQLDLAGVGYAIASGALASGVGYAIWYRVLPALQATQAATVQLSVPVIAAIGGALLLDETISLRLVLASTIILGGIALVILSKGNSQN